MAVELGIFSVLFLSAQLLVPEQNVPTPVPPQAPEPQSTSLVCSGQNGTVVIDLSKGDALLINIPSTLWPKKGDGWYQMTDLVDELTVVRGKIDLGGAKAPFSFDKYTLRLSIEKSELSYFVTMKKPLYLNAICVRR